MSYQGIIIAATAVGNSGKTTAIRGTWDALKSQGANVISEDIQKCRIPGKVGDVTGVLEYQGVRIGISSWGDPGINQKGILQDFIQAKCRIIICACRTWGQTKDPIDALQKSWVIRYLGPAKNGFVSRNDVENEVKKAVQEIKSGKI